MRIREWYSYHFPELVKIVPDNYLYAKVARFIGSRKDLTEDKLEELEELVMDTTKAQAIFEAARVSMGMDISPIDLINIERFATRVVDLAEYRKQLSTYLSSRMHNVAPNLTTLVGEQVGARLISHAGSLTNLAKYPASTVQILGAEKALFRALKTKGNTPKYGLIFHSTYIGRAGSKNKGRVSRYLANKCSIASRIDCFSDVPTTKFGEKLKEQVEERLTFFETGATPRKNIDVMKEAMSELEAATEDMDTAATEETPKSEKKKKKKKKRKREREAEDMDATATSEALDTTIEGAELDDSAMATPKPKKKKKSKKHSVEEDN